MSNTDDGGKQHDPRAPKHQEVLPPASPSVPDDKQAVAAVHDFDMLSTLQAMRQVLVEDLMARLKSGTATHQELAVMTRLLKDNGITLMPYERPPPSHPPGPWPQLHEHPSPVPALPVEVKDLPTFADEEEDDGDAEDTAQEG